MSETPEYEISVSVDAKGLDTITLIPIVSEATPFLRQAKTSKARPDKEFYMPIMRFAEWVRRRYRRKTNYRRRFKRQESIL